MKTILGLILAVGLCFSAPATAQTTPLFTVAQARTVMVMFPKESIQYTAMYGFIAGSVQTAFLLDRRVCVPATWSQQTVINASTNITTTMLDEIRNNPAWAQYDDQAVIMMVAKTLRGLHPCS